MFKEMIKDYLHSVFVLPFLVAMYVARYGFYGKQFAFFTLPTLVVSSAVTVSVAMLLGSAWFAIGAGTFIAYGAMLGLYRFDEAERTC